MELKWTRKALSDIARLYEFLAAVNQPAAERTIQKLTSAPTTLLENPRIGERLEEFEPRDVRRIQIGRYEIRYEIVNSTIYLLRAVAHARIDSMVNVPILLPGTVQPRAIVMRQSESDEVTNACANDPAAQL